MMRRLSVLAVIVGAVVVMTCTIPDWALVALAVLAWGVYFATIRAERGTR